MGAKRVLFLDDRSDRIRGAIRFFPPPEYQLDFVFTTKECLQKLSENLYDDVYLDYDLDYSSFETSPSSSGMDVVKYITQHEWPNPYAKPRFIVHSTNKFGAETMAEALTDAGFIAFAAPWRYTKHITGIVTGAFDLIHPGYIRLFKDAKTVCQHLTVAINTNGKRKPFMSVEEKAEILYSIRYVDRVITYGSEKELDELIPLFDIKINGSDHKDKSTRPSIPQYYHDRNHDWSTTKLIKLIRSLT